MKTLLTFLMLFAMSAGAGSKYYISTTGSDGNAGTFAAPWATFAKFETVAAAGDTLVVRGGTYSEWVKYDTKTGTRTNPIIIMAFPGEDPIIDGGGTIPGVGYTSYGLIHIHNHYFYISGLQIKNSGGVGVYLGGTGNQVSNLTVHDTYSSGIYAGGDSSVVEDCNLYDVVLMNLNGILEGVGTWGAGIHASRGGYGSSQGKDAVTDYAIIRRNTVTRCWGEGMSQYEARHGIVEDNTICNTYSVGLYLSDAQYILCRRNLVYISAGYTGTRPEVGMSLYDEQGSPAAIGDTITNNMVMGYSRNLYIGKGNQDDVKTDFLIANNTFVNSTGIAGVHVTGDVDNYVNFSFTNNIIVQEGALPAIYFNYGSSQTIDFSYNLWSKTPDANASGTGDVVGDPLLTGGDATEGNLSPAYFVLLPASPAINAGVDLGWGDDIGAQQYSAGGTPTITASIIPLNNFGSVNTGSSSSSQNYTVSGVNLTDDIDITAPTHFQVSLNNSTWTSSIALTPSDGTVATTTIYARFTPSSIGLKSGNITHVSPSATTKNVAVNGTGSTPITATDKRVWRLE